VNAQAFVEGPEATSAVACWQGKILASLRYEVIRRQDGGGPSTVLRAIEHPEIASAEEKIVGQLNLSGLHGFDYILEKKTGKPYLIEMNPRATQVCHLAMGTGHDLPRALYAVLTGNPLRESSGITKNDTIALFPQEWIRDASSPYLGSAYHDVPWEEPELIRACIETRPRGNPWFAPKKWMQSTIVNSD
jgi:hypothetical protein